MRRKRHLVIYEVAGLVAKQEATQVVEFARKFVESLKKEITGPKKPGS